MTVKKEEYVLLVDWDDVFKSIKKQPEDVKKRIKHFILSLRFSPSLHADYLCSFGSNVLYKKRIEEIEIYYSVESGVAVVVLGYLFLGNVVYQGIEEGVKAGQHKGKKTTKQINTINKYKEKFSKKYNNARP